MAVVMISHVVLLKIMLFLFNPPEGFMGGGRLFTVLISTWIHLIHWG